MVLPLATHRRNLLPVAGMPFPPVEDGQDRRFGAVLDKSQMEP